VRILTNLGAAVETAANGREALERLTLERFDILLLDLEMPEIDGIGVAREIRAREQGTKSRLPIVALTAHAREEQRELCFRAGMDGFVTKPFEERDLTSAMRAALKLTPAKALPVHDRDSAMARASGDRALLDELTRIFLEENPETLRKIEQALEARDAKSVERLAHRLKGALLTLAAPRAAEAALELETEGTAESFQRLRREVSRLEDELKSHALEGKA
jgi:CheY-like chemotaxis protein